MLIPENNTLIDVLRWRAEHQPDNIAYIFLGDGENETQSLTYAQLDKEARVIAAALQEQDAAGERALLLYPPGLEFISAFLGCLYAGVIAVPAFAPRRGRTNDHLRLISEDCQARFALTTQEHLQKLEKTLTQVPEWRSLNWLATPLETEQPETWQPRPTESSDLAYLQYTSGSTSAPKGVMVSHGNLNANLSHISEAGQTNAESVAVNWLPHFHDMGLVGGILQPLLVGFPSILLPPMSFLQQPANWLWAISKYGGTHCGGPNFGYELCVQKVDPDQIAALDLSSWRWAFSGAERIRQETMQGFVEKFSPYGFQSQAVTHLYGLAEATLFVSGGDIEAEPVYSDAIAGCGFGRGDIQIIVVDPETCQECPDGDAATAGEIWVRGESVSQGYWERDEETRQTFQAFLEETGEGPFLRTGDLGFVREGELFITGRLKDMIIIRGQNYYPEDIEPTVSSAHEALESDGCACFSVERGDAERLVILQEVKREKRHGLDTASVVESIRYAVSRGHALNPHSIVLLKPATLLRTTSGKIRRQACRQAYLEDRLSSLHIWQAQDDIWKTLAFNLSENSFDASQVRELTGHQRRAAITDYLAWVSGKILPLPYSGDLWQKPLEELGLDSLGRMNLLLQVSTDLEIALEFEALASPEVNLEDLLGLIEKKLDTAPGPIPLNQTADRDWPAPVDLSPYMYQFIDQGYADLDRHLLGFYLRTPVGVDAAALESALGAVIGHHDAYSMRLVPDDSNFKLIYTADEGATNWTHQRIDAASFSAETMRAMRENLIEELQDSISLEHGPLITSCLLDRGGSQNSILIIYSHHFIMDGLSVVIFRRQLEHAYARILAGQDVRLPPAVSFGSWINSLVDFTKLADLEDELVYWREQSQRMPPNPPRVFNAEQVMDTGNLVSAWGELTAAESQRFLEKYPQAQEQHDVFLSAFAQAWAETTSYKSLSIKLMSHGRQPFGKIRPNIFNTIGCFLSQYPLLLDLNADSSVEAMLQQVQDRLRAIPQAGRTFEALKYFSCNPDVSSAMQALPYPQVSFTYRHRLHSQSRDLSTFMLLGSISPPVPFQDRLKFYSHMHCSASLKEGGIRWFLNSRLGYHNQEDVEKIAARWGSYISQSNIGYS